MIRKFETNQKNQLGNQSRIDDLTDEIEKLSKKLESCKDTSEYEKAKQENRETIRRLQNAINQYTYQIESNNKIKKMLKKNEINYLKQIRKINI